MKRFLYLGCRSTENSIKNRNNTTNNNTNDIGDSKPILTDDGKILEGYLKREIVKKNEDDLELDYGFFAENSSELEHEYTRIIECGYEHSHKNNPTGFGNRKSSPLQPPPPIPPPRPPKTKYTPTAKTTPVPPSEQYSFVRPLSRELSIAFRSRGVRVADSLGSRSKCNANATAVPASTSSELAATTTPGIYDSTGVDPGSKATSSSSSTQTELLTSYGISDLFYGGNFFNNRFHCTSFQNIGTPTDQCRQPNRLEYYHYHHQQQHHHHHHDPYRYRDHGVVANDNASSKNRQHQPKIELCAHPSRRDAASVEASTPAPEQRYDGGGDHNENPNKKQQKLNCDKQRRRLFDFNEANGTDAASAAAETCTSMSNDRRLVKPCWLTVCSRFTPSTGHNLSIRFFCCYRPFIKISMCNIKRIGVLFDPCCVDMICEVFNDHAYINVNKTYDTGAELRKNRFICTSQLDFCIATSDKNSEAGSIVAFKRPEPSLSKKLGRIIVMSSTDRLIVNPVSVTLDQYSQIRHGDMRHFLIDKIKSNMIQKDQWISDLVVVV